MKEYPSINGPSNLGLPCIAFYKYDGSNIRAEWSKKRGWYKFGTRHRMLDETDPLFGGAVKVFQENLAEEISKVIKDNKDYRGIDGITVFCEYFGPSSIGMYHDYEELKREGKLVLFDVNINKRGFVVPRDFVRNFGHIENSAKVIYDGNFNKQFIQDVYNGVYPVKEGVVAKGIKDNQKGRQEHGLWMAKCKTKWWFEELNRKYIETKDNKFKELCDSNMKEQEYEFNP